MSINEKFQKLGVVPVVVIEDVKDALPLAKALVEGGLPCAEVTFRTEAAAEAKAKTVTKTNMKTNNLILGLTKS